VKRAVNAVTLAAGLEFPQAARRIARQPTRAVKLLIDAG
jgi:hypothetical protein